jgi:hypothetical protein
MHSSWNSTDSRYRYDIRFMTPIVERAAETTASDNDAHTKPTTTVNNKVKHIRRQSKYGIVIDER